MKSKHHIVPKSRSKRMKNKKENIAMIDKTLHEKYHSLFQNKTPDEIIEYLVRYFWKNQWSWVKEALKGRE